MQKSYSLIAFILIFCIFVPKTLNSQNAMQTGSHRRFEYKYSFKGPYLAQKDGTVPFWEYSGDAIASEELVRVTPSLHSKKGQIWSKLLTNFEWWEVDLVFRVNGKGRLGADGLAFWYTSQRYPSGPVFGSADHWHGLALFFDSFDNDNQGNNPYIMAMLNDGTRSYDHNSDGLQQQIQGCLRDFRNKPFPVRAKIEYYKNVLTLMFHSGNTNNEDDYELCFRAENIYLPKYGHFGITAATGGLADDHDVLKFLTYSISDQAQANQQVGISDADKQRLNKEYEVYKEKLERQREEYLKSHPDIARKAELESDKAVESDFDYSVKELRQIFLGQSEVFEHVKVMNRKLDEIFGRQERILSLISNIQTGGTQGLPPGQGKTILNYSFNHLIIKYILCKVPAIPISRHEVETILGVQREVLQNSRETKVLLQHGTPNNNVQVSPQHGGGSQDSANQQLALLQQLLSEVRENMNVIRREFGTLSTRISSQPAAAHVSPMTTINCISTSTFIMLLFVHLILLLGGLYYFSRRENQSKKFY